MAEPSRTDDVARQRLGSELRRLRKAAGLTQSVLAQRVGYSRVYVTLVETGRDAPGEDFVRRMAELLEGGAVLQRLYAELKRSDATTDDRTRDMAENVNRRELLLGISSIALAAATPSSAALGQRALLPELTAATPIEHFREMRKVLVDSDNLFGPQDVIPTSYRQIDLLQQLRAGARGADARALVSMQAQFAEFAAWLHQDSGEFEAAHYWADRALEWSHISGDRELTTFVLARKSQLAGDMRDAVTAVQVGEAAASFAGESSRLAAVAATYSAHGHALARDGAASARSYDEAHELLVVSEQASPSQWGAWLDDSYIELQRARSLAVLGDFAVAAKMYERAIAELPNGYPRDRGVYLARAALAHVGMQDLGGAATLGLEALAIRASTGSGRITAGLQQLDDELGAFDSSEAREFRDGFRTAHAS